MAEPKKKRNCGEIMLKRRTWDFAQEEQAPFPQNSFTPLLKRPLAMMTKNASQMFDGHASHHHFA